MNTSPTPTTTTIALNQPTLFKTKLNTNSQLNLELGDYPVKLFYALKNYFSSSNEFPNFKIDIKFMELEKLKADRRKALSYKKLFNPQKANITIIFNDEKYKPCPLLIEMVKNNNLGIKTGQGFYDYSEGPRNKKVASQFQK